MKAIICNPTGELHFEDIPAPSFNHHSYPEARIRIKAFGINRADLLQRAGHYPAPPGTRQDILGLEFSGEIESFSNQQQQSGDFRIGDRVMGICNGAAYAEQIIVPRDQLIPIPKYISFTEAAAIPEVHLTAFDALINQGRIQPDQKVLIHAIGSGVGSAAAHIAHFLGAKVIGTTRSDWKRKRAYQSLPIEKVWLAENGSFRPKDDQSCFDLILDFIGAAYFKENMACLNSNGHLVVIGLLGGIKTDLNLGLLLTKRAHITGTVLRSRSVKEKVGLIQKYRHMILPYLSSSSEHVNLKNKFINLEPIHRIFNYKDIFDAHQHLENGLVWSKLVCIWD